MSELKPSIHDEANGLDYILVGDCYIPAIELPEADDRRRGRDRGLETPITVGVGQSYEQYCRSRREKHQA